MSSTGSNAMQWEKIADAIEGSEGPIFTADGVFHCVAPDRGQVLKHTSGGMIELANTGGVPAGLQADARGRLWVADMKLGILRIDTAGRVEPVVTEFNRSSIRGCNDLSFDSRGNLYFTAPAGSNLDNRVGEVFCRTIDGQVHRLDHGFAFCNGIAVSEDDHKLIVAETWTKKLFAYDIVAPGRVTSRREFATLAGTHVGGPDGIDFDAAGLLLVTNWGGACIEVFDSSGKRVDILPTPFEKPSNLHLGGAGGRALWVTEHSFMGVWSATWKHPGLTRFPDVD